MSDSLNSESETYHCDRCGWEETDLETTICVEIPLTGEMWDLCDPCVDELVEWIEGGQK